MAVNFGNGVDYNTWLAMQNANYAQGQYQNPYVTNSQLEYQNDSYNFSSQDNKCTDGKNDGKIGFFSALGNATQGVAKTIVNGVKGMFTDSEGKFSLGKTLLSVGTAALCFAVPAVGLAACAVGGVMGAVQVGKGIYNAATAETDAEAKQAWENIGGGAFTVAASVAGAKAGVKAVKATSSAGGAQGVSALSQLDDAATIGQKATALGKDMLSSTKNQVGSIKTATVSYAKNLKSTRNDYKSAKAEYNQAGKAFNEAKKNGWTEETFQAADDLRIAQDKLVAAESNYRFSGIENKISNYANKGNSTIQNAAKHPIQTAKNLASTETGAKVVNAAKHPIQTAKNLASTETGAKVVNAAKHPIQTAKNLASTETGAKVVNAAKHPIKTGQQAWNTMKAKVNTPNFKELGQNLTGNAKKIYNALKDGSTPYEKIVNQYGYESVAETLLALSGVAIASESV